MSAEILSGKTFSELYQAIVDRVLGGDAESALRRFLIVRTLEGEVGKQFNNTRDFNYLCQTHIATLQTGDSRGRTNGAD